MTRLLSPRRMLFYEVSSNFLTGIFQLAWRPPASIFRASDK